VSDDSRSRLDVEPIIGHVQLVRIRARTALCDRTGPRSLTANALSVSAVADGESSGRRGHRLACVGKVDIA
jgi:hypothetical protein